MVPRSLSRPREALVPLLPLIGLLAATCILGTAYSLSTPAHVINARSRLPAAAIRAAQQARSTGAFSAAPNLPYFANKLNPFNQYGVKLGWLWTFSAALLFILASFVFPPTLYSGESSVPESPWVGANNSAFPPRSQDDNQDDQTPHPWTTPLPPATTISPMTSRNIFVAQFRRLAIATLYWYLLTQSSIALPLSKGPSISHYILLYTGAYCVGPGGNVCQGRVGEYWKGGHDVSGHTFILTHATMLLITIVFPTFKSMLVVKRPRVPQTPHVPQWGQQPITTDAKGTKIVPSAPMKVTATICLVLAGVWWWMLLMTSMYFHSPQEKASGFIFGMAGWWISGF
ncbi:hypothetical protein T439DRAFT_321771 [Meredithblackwellia eburnea MCA 4105]